MVRRADAVSAVTQPIADDFARRFGRPVATITTASIPTRCGTPMTTASDIFAPTAGRWSTPARSPTEGARSSPCSTRSGACTASAPAAAETLEIVLVGPVTDAERDAVKRAGMSHAFSLTGALSHDEALAVQRAADGLLVITGPGQTGVATGKLYEYMAANRPILVIGDDTAAAQIVQRAGAGIAVARRRPGGAGAGAAPLRRAARRAPPAEPREKVREFAYPGAGGADGGPHRGGAGPAGRGVTAEASADPLVQSPAPGI